MKTHPFPQQLLGSQLILSTSIWILEKTSEIEKSTHNLMVALVLRTYSLNTQACISTMGYMVQVLLLNGYVIYLEISVENERKGFCPSYTEQQDVGLTL